MSSLPSLQLLKKAPVSSRPLNSLSEPKYNFLTEGRQTLALSLPLIAGQLSQMLMGVVDTIMVGKLGVVQLGAATLANTLVVIPLVLGIGLLTSVSVRVSQAHGAREPMTASRMLRHGTWLAVAFGVLSVIAALLLLPFLGYLSQPAEVVAVTPHYLTILAFSLIPAFLTMTWKNHADALNQPWTPFWIIFGSVGLNVVLNWLLIWGHWGLPQLGLEGAAYATLIARAVAAVVLFRWLTRSKATRLWTPARWLSACDIASFRTLLKVGIPTSLQLLTEVGAFAVCTLLIGTLGAVPLAAHQVAINCVSMAFMVPLGIAMAMTVRVGEALGSGQTGKLHHILTGGWVFATAFMCLSMTFFLLFGQWIASHFVADAGVITIAAHLLIVAGLFQLFDGIQVVSAFALRGVNDVRVPAWLAFAAYWIVAVPVGAFLGLHLKWGATGMWTGLAAGLFMAAIILSIRAWTQLGRVHVMG